MTQYGQFDQAVFFLVCSALYLAGLVALWFALAMYEKILDKIIHHLGIYGALAAFVGERDRLMPRPWWLRIVDYWRFFKWGGER